MVGSAGEGVRWLSGSARLRHRDPGSDASLPGGNIGPDPRLSSFARCGGPVLRGAPTTPDAEPQSRGPKAGPAARKRYGCRSPTQNRSTPSSTWHQRLRLSRRWESGLTRAGWDGTDGSDCPVVGTVGWGGPDGSWVGTAGSECPMADQVGWGGSDRVGLTRWLLSVQGLGWWAVVHNVFCCPQALVAGPVLSGSSLGCISGALVADDLAGQAEPSGFRVSRGRLGGLGRTWRRVGWHQRLLMSSGVEGWIGANDFGARGGA
ncbi:hypothetical protein LV75_005412 [Actinokineospora diospyrosa]|uniref:Uncharacterized protein n=1 Tax=Actinokineospora diospyrosa TaxID=103728 RepID=A0ABT1IK40_9PSEU|nr:hypothetical protein [Actinokineospora diospyrosa]